MVKNPPVNVGHTDLLPGLGRSPGERLATPSSILAWKIPWTEEAGGLQSMGLQKESNCFCLTKQKQYQSIDINGTITNLENLFGKYQDNTGALLLAYIGILSRFL